MQNEENKKELVKSDLTLIKVLLVLLLIVVSVILITMLVFEADNGEITELVRYDSPVSVSAARKSICVIGPKRVVDADRMGEGIEKSSVFCNAGTRGCGSCVEQCRLQDKIIDLHDCPLAGGDGYCNPDFPGTDPDCNWTLQNSGTTRTISDIKFVNANSGWAARTDGRVMRTTDGGSTWSSQTLMVNPLMALDFVNSSNGWVVGQNGNIFDTTNGGLTWNAEGKETLQDLNGVSFVGLSDGWAVGDSGVIIHTSNGGLGWGNQSSGVSQNLHDVHFVKASTGWAVGDGNAATSEHTVLKTTDGGITWALVGESSFPTGHESFTSVVFLDSSRGYISSPTLGVYYTSDGGSSWTNKYAGTVDDLDFVDVNNGWLAANDTVIHTINGGTSWTSVFLGGSGQFNAIDFIDLFNGWVAGGGGDIFYTDTGGS